LQNSEDTEELLKQETDSKEESPADESIDNEIADAPSTPEESTKIITSISTDNAHEYSFSKKSHLEFFMRMNYDQHLYSKRQDFRHFNISEYQNLLIYAFIRNNLPQGSSILYAGEEYSPVVEKLKDYYEIWMFDNPSDIEKNSTDIENKIVIHKVVNENEKMELPYQYFDFVFSTSAFEKLTPSSKIYDNVIYNISRVLKSGGHSAFCFYYVFKNKEVWANSFFFYLYNYALYYNKRFNRFIPNEDIISDPDIYSTTENLKSLKHSGDDNIIVLSFNLFFRKYYTELPKKIDTLATSYIKKTPAYVFHHLMKCGGTSITLALQKWFMLEFDLLEESKEINNFLKYKFNTGNFIEDNCLVGHFQYDGIFLNQRYPEIFEDKNKYRIFTFIRDPLSVRVSLYYYIRKSGGFADYTLSKIISNTPNFISNLFPCNENNYKEILDRYFFIGIVERMQESFDKLAEMTGKKKIELPFTNTTEKDSQMDQLTPEFREKFKQDNSLDYLIYDYCIKKFDSL